MWPDRLREAHVCFLYLSLILIKSRFLAKGTAVKDLDIAVELQLAAEELSEDTVVFR